MIRTYSLERDGSKQLSKNFRVSEFACQDGADTVLIDDVLVQILQKLRDQFGVPIFIRSGYRTIRYNSKIGGALRSRHLSGQAADIDIGSDPSLVNPLLVAMTAQALGSHGIGFYQYSDGQSWVHVGSETYGNCWIQFSPNNPDTILTFLPVLKKELKTEKNEFCLVLQSLLQSRGFKPGELDGMFGTKTNTALKNFQKSVDLIPDGICGPKTWNKLLIG